MAAMTKLAVASVLAAVFCLPAEAQTISVTILDQAGAQIMLQAAIKRAQQPAAEIEDSINQGRTAFVTAGIVSLRGGMPVRLNGEVVGAVGVAGSSKETDVDVARLAAAALGPSARILHD